MNEDQHWARAQITYIYSLLDYCAEKSVILSMDDKAKVDLGKTAVSKYVKVSKLFLKRGKSSLPDHDFPISEKFKIIPSGYLLMERSFKLLGSTQGPFRKSYIFTIALFDTIQQMQKLIIRIYAQYFSLELIISLL